MTTLLNTAAMVAAAVVTEVKTAAAAVEKTETVVTVVINPVMGPAMRKKNKTNRVPSPVKTATNVKEMSLAGTPPLSLHLDSSTHRPCSRRNRLKNKAGVRVTRSSMTHHHMHPLA